MKNITILLFAILAASQISLANNDIFNQPINKLVVDNANQFTQNELNALTQKLNAFSNETSTQILVYTTNDLMGYDPGDFAQRLGEGWKVGSKGFDNGIVIIFKPKTVDSRGEVWISAGYGIEALIPDATANQIVENEMIPFFKQNRIFDGINAGVDVCIALTKEEFTAQAYGEQKQSSGSGGGLFFIIIFAVVFFSIFGKSRGSRYYNAGSGKRSNLPLWTALFLMGSGSNRGSGFGNFSSGSGSFGGGSSFGGFGGGSFGGGGAGGSW